MPEQIGPEALTVEVPELVSFDLELADVASRFLALALDTVIRLLALMGLAYAWVQFDGFLDDVLAEELYSFITRYLGVAAVLGLVTFWFGYFIFFEATRGGRTPGKQMLKLRVVTDFGGPIGWTESFIRNALRLVDSLPTFYGTGLLVMLLNSRAQRLGDLAAGTLVVRDTPARQMKGELLVGLREVPLPEAEPVDLPPRPPLSARDHDLLMNYFTRRGEFSVEGRIALARRIVRHLWPEGPADLYEWEPESVLSAYVRAWRRENPAEPVGNGDPAANVRSFV